MDFPSKPGLQASRSLHCVPVHAPAAPSPRTTQFLVALAKRLAILDSHLDKHQQVLWPEWPILLSLMFYVGTACTDLVPHCPASLAAKSHGAQVPATGWIEKHVALSYYNGGLPNPQMSGATRQRNRRLSVAPGHPAVFYTLMHEEVNSGLSHCY